MPRKAIIARNWISSDARTGDPVEVVFAPKAAKMRQRRFRDIEIYRPEINLQDFRARAVLDYVSLQISLTAPTQLKYLRNKVDRVSPPRVPSIVQVDGDTSSHTGRIWTIKLQNVEPAEIVSYVKFFTDALDLAVPVKISEAEVSVDFYHKAQSDVERRRLVSVLRHTLIPAAAGTGRDQSRARTAAVTRSKKYLFPAPGVVASNTYLDTSWSIPGPLDHTYYVGAESDPVMIRLQDKITDERTSTSFRELKPEERRAGIEVTLRSEKLQELGIDEVDRFLAFPVTTLQKLFFSFWLPGFRLKAEASTIVAAAAEWMTQKEVEQFRVGGMIRLRWLREKKLARRELLHAEKNRAEKMLGKALSSFKPPPPRISGSDLAYAELNDMVQRALKDLKDRMSRALKV